MTANPSEVCVLAVDGATIQGVGKSCTLQSVRCGWLFSSRPSPRFSGYRAVSRVFLLVIFGFLNCSAFHRLNIQPSVDKMGKTWLLKHPLSSLAFPTLQVCGYTHTNWSTKRMSLHFRRSHQVCLVNCHARSIGPFRGWDSEFSRCWKGPRVTPCLYI